MGRTGKNWGGLGRTGEDWGELRRNGKDWEKWGRTGKDWEDREDWGAGERGRTSDDRNVGFMCNYIDPDVISDKNHQKWH